MITKEQNQAIKEFEDIKEKAELKVLSQRSLEKPLNDSEFKRFKELGDKRIKC